MPQKITKEKIINKLIYEKTRMIDFFLNLLEKILGKYITIHTRPIYGRDFYSSSDQNIHTPLCGIVIQGPLNKKNDFTLETIKIYKKIFPGHKIILSTWDTEDKNYLKKFANLNIELLLNPTPKNGGFKNINFQLISTLNGIKLAKKLNAEYVIKTRTDQRIHRTDLLPFLHNLLKLFPPKNNFDQNQRIIINGYGSRTSRLYHATDMFMFGHIDDIYKYWDHEPMEKIDDPENFCPEKFLLSQFMKNIGRDLKWTKEDTIEIFKDHLIFVDPIMLDWYWHKYGRYTEHKNISYKTTGHEKKYMSFVDWLNL